MSKNVSLTDFLTADEIAQALSIWRSSPTPAAEIADKVIAPNIVTINLKLGQENDPKYLAYCCEHVFNQTAKRTP